MTRFKSLKTLWQAWTRRFDEAAAELPLIGAWFRPKWSIVIAHGDGRFTMPDGAGGEVPLSAEQLRQLGRQKRICLRLDRDLGQQRGIVLPLAARDDPAGAIALSAEQYFPFPGDDTAFAVADGVRPAGEGHGLFQVSFARRSLLQKVYEQARAAGLAPRAVDVIGTDPLAPVSIDLLSGTRAGGGNSASQLLLILSAVLLAIALVNGAFSALVLTPQAERLQTAARPGTADQALVQKKAKAAAPSVLAIWRAATHALPDSAYAQYLLYEKGHLRLAGKADDAADLVNLVEAQPLFHDTSFAAASIKDAQGKESFDLLTRVGKGRAP